VLKAVVSGVGSARWRLHEIFPPRTALFGVGSDCRPRNLRVPAAAVRPQRPRRADHRLLQGDQHRRWLQDQQFDERAAQGRARHRHPHRHRPRFRAGGEPTLIRRRDRA